MICRRLRCGFQYWEIPPGRVWNLEGGIRTVRIFRRVRFSCDAGKLIRLAGKQFITEARDPAFI